MKISNKQWQPQTDSKKQYQVRFYGIVSVSISHRSGFYKIAVNSSAKQMAALQSPEKLFQLKIHGSEAAVSTLQRSNEWFQLIYMKGLAKNPKWDIMLLSTLCNFREDLVNYFEVKVWKLASTFKAGEVLSPCLLADVHT